MINVNFTILDETIDPKHIIVVDTSDWDVIEDQPATIEVKVPGYKNPVSNFFNKYEVNIITAKSLKLQEIDCPQEADLPDGIYHITIKGTPETYYREKDFLKTDRLRLKFDKMLVSMLGDCNKLSDYNKEMFNTVNFLILASKASVRLGDWCKANEMYKNAETMLNQLACK